MYTISHRIESIWDWCQGSHVDMYRTRVGRGPVSWVVEVPSPLLSRFLSEFSQCVQEIYAIKNYPV
jgi:hypothetical protein